MLRKTNLFPFLLVSVIWVTVFIGVLFGRFTEAATNQTSPMCDEEFLELCKNGNIQEIEAAIKNGADVNAKNNYGLTPLMISMALKNAGWYHNPKETIFAIICERCSKNQLTLLN